MLCGQYGKSRPTYICQEDKKHRGIAYRNKGD